MRGIPLRRFCFPKISLCRRRHTFPLRRLRSTQIPLDHFRFRLLQFLRICYRALKLAKTSSKRAAKRRTAPEPWLDTEFLCITLERLEELDGKTLRPSARAERWLNCDYELSPAPGDEGDSRSPSSSGTTLVGSVALVNLDAESYTAHLEALGGWEAEMQRVRIEIARARAEWQSLAPGKIVVRHTQIHPIQAALFPVDWAQMRDAPRSSQPHEDLTQRGTHHGLDAQPPSNLQVIREDTTMRRHISRSRIQPMARDGSISSIDRLPSPFISDHGCTQGSG